MSESDLGKLLCVGIRGATPGEPQLEEDLETCRRAGVGGVILFDVDVPAQRRLQAEEGPEVAARRAPRNIVDSQQLKNLVAHVRERLGEQVFVSIDQEGGRVARLSPTRGFAADPSAAEFGALERAVQQEAAEHQAARLWSLGFDLNFAPCVDLAIEPANEIIVGLDRSYGRDPESVVEAARVVLEAHRRMHVAACLKHFPGHGSSRGDTHRGAVDITDTWQRERELAPYQALCNQPGLAVMVAHVMHRHLDPKRPSSLSPAVIENLLRRELGYDGVVVTDSIDMRAIADHFTPGEAAVAAVEAGADFVVDGFNLDERPEHPATELVRALHKALQEGRLRRKRIERSLQRLQRLRDEIGYAS
jgi:beta-N-acetylhexosaminidase